MELDRKAKTLLMIFAGLQAFLFYFEPVEVTIVNAIWYGIMGATLMFVVYKIILRRRGDVV